ncbi:hypothetical protein CpipJ_CPIJ005325 [Culex quinquefasciatus]|uniref:Uncharacterized protein n=1 Tax=Culex quinquefasciatus TaxID=7176 RepID=B0WDI3_CULQU|nr:hypothetical protein CpipJ_CPIJ005325 [Culex quinquefasciatus]|eukprot:XP_001846767.1 hypothetical protein CpipJ_CPIJ005325 [Culex quinquefasciatus]
MATADQESHDARKRKASVKFKDFEGTSSSFHAMKTKSALLTSIICVVFFKSGLGQDVESAENFRTVTKDYCEWRYSCCEPAEPLSRCRELCFRSWNCVEPTEQPEPAEQLSSFRLFSSRGGFYDRTRLRPARVVCPEGYKPDHRNRCRKVFDFE